MKITREEFNNLAWVAAFLLVIGCVGIGSVFFLGPDNIVEDLAEEEIETVAEDELHLEKGKLKPELDLIFPHKKPTKED